MMYEAEADVLAFMVFPKTHRTKTHSANPLERLNGDINRRTKITGVFLYEAAIVRQVGTLLLEQNDEWLMNCWHMQLEGVRLLAQNTPERLSALAR